MYHSDIVKWKWGQKGNFCTKLVYNFRSFRGVPNKDSGIWWNLKMPLKNKVIIYLPSTNKILTKQNLQNKGWQGDVSCMLCNTGSMETHTHLFISCPYVRNIWFFLGMGQNFQCQWHKMTDIFDFALSLQHVQQNAFY